MAEGVKRSKVEDIKEDSVYLKGPVVEELESGSGTVSDEAYELLKFHGSYSGYDRDSATERKKAGLEKKWEFMLRMKAPGGRIAASQYLALDEICEKYANGTLRITTRETFQFHCIVKENLKKHIAAINELMLTTLGGCGDVVRNVMCSPGPIKDEVHEKLLSDANKVSEFTLPKTSAYHEIWLDGKNVARNTTTDNYEPLYGKMYLPRKFKIGLAVPEDNSIDVLTHDLAIILIYQDGEFKGYNLCLGGGLGITHNKADTYPRLATPIAFIGPDDLLKGVEAVVKLTRDYGDRANRKHARLKYVVQERGVEWTRTTLEEYFGAKMDDPVDMGEFKIVDHMGWHEQGDGKWYLGVPVASGRIRDFDDVKLRTGLREVVKKFSMPIVLTADQNLILCDIEEGQKEDVVAVLRLHGIKLLEDISAVDRDMLACVALPTCGKALAEAERIRQPLLQKLEGLMQKHGIDGEKIAVRVAGCPNGCSRPYVGDIGVVGRMPGHYAVFIGGDFEGTRLNTKILDRVPFDNLEDVFEVLFGVYAVDKNAGEGFGDFADRVGVGHLAGVIEQSLVDTHKWAKAVV